jgi:hypothetical protein
MRYIEELLRHRVETLEAELKAAPEQLLKAIQELLAGRPDGRAKVTELWARIRDDRDREELLPRLVAEVADGIEAIVGRFSTNGDAFARWPNFRKRVEWLIDALRPDVGHTVHRYSWNADAERIWKHVVAALAAADEERGRFQVDWSDT